MVSGCVCLGDGCVLVVCRCHDCRHTTGQCVDNTDAPSWKCILKDDFASGTIFLIADAQCNSVSLQESGGRACIGNNEPSAVEGYITYPELYCAGPPVGGGHGVFSHPEEEENAMVARSATVADLVECPVAVAWSWRCSITVMGTASWGFGGGSSW